MAERELKLSFTYADTPPSLNKVGASGGPFAFAREKKRWQKIFEDSLMVTGFPREWEEIVVSARLRFPTKVRRDEGNFRVMLEKAMGDALANGGWVEDDTPEHFRFERVHFEQQTGSALTTIELVAK